jgi:hypothetical protein
MTPGVVLDIVLVALLIAGGAGGLIVNRRLNRLMTAQEELKTALAGFDDAASRADFALKRLEAGGVARGAELKAATDRAQALVNELSVMTSAGERIADRIDGAVKDVRRLGGGSPNPKRAA